MGKIYCIKQGIMEQEDNKIYCVNVFYFDDNENKLWKRSRCWGWFSTFELAEQCVLENWTDIYEEGYYNAAMIEEVGEGVPAIRTKEYWYSVEFEPENDKYKIETITKPEHLKILKAFSFY